MLEKFYDMYSDLNLNCTKENTSQLVQINPGRFSVLTSNVFDMFSINDFYHMLFHFISSHDCRMQYVSSLGRLCSHTPASVLALTCLLIRNLTMTNQAT